MSLYHYEKYRENFLFFFRSKNNNSLFIQVLDKWTINKSFRFDRVSNDEARHLIVILEI